MSLTLSTSPAFGAAASASRVALVRPATADANVQEAVARIEGELRAVGFEVVVADSSDGTQRETLERIAAATQSFAAIAVLPAKGGAAADLMVVDRATNKTVIRTIEAPKRSGENVSALLAILSVELLQASLLEARDARDRQTVRDGAPAASELPPDVSEWMNPRGAPLQGFAFEGGVGMLHGLAGVGPSFAPVLRASYGASSGWLGRVTVAGPAAGGVLEGNTGTASVREELAVLEVGFAREVARSGWVAVATLGCGVYHLAASGSLDPPYQSESDDMWGAAVDLGLGLGYRFDDRWMALVDGHAVFIDPRPNVVAGTESLGKAGRPSLLASLGIAARFGR